MFRSIKLMSTYKNKLYCTFMYGCNRYMPMLCVYYLLWWLFVYILLV